MAPPELFPAATPAERAAKPSTIAVTGATGYVAATIVARLLAQGHTVHGTCRDAKKAEDLKALPGAADRLKLFSADLLQDGSFDAAFEGCDYVVHCASPYRNDVAGAKAAEELLLKPAVKGTENVLASVTKIKSIKRVVLTSSIAAVMGRSDEREPGHVFTDKDWAITPSLTRLPYYHSKREAEKRAWAIAKEQSRWDLVVVNPAGIFGPPVTSRSDGESLGIAKNIWDGMMYPAVPRMGIGMVDVRDVAVAHCAALFEQKANGRYIVAPESLYMSDLCNMLAEDFPNKVKKPFMRAPKWLLWMVGPMMPGGMTRDMVTNLMGLPAPPFDCSKARTELGMEFIPIKKALKDQIDAMLEKKLIKA